MLTLEEIPKGAPEPEYTRARSVSTDHGISPVAHAQVGSRVASKWS